MKVLGIYGSPRKNGNSDVLLDAALDAAAGAGAEVDRVYARSEKVNGCLECGGCDDTGVCVQKDAMSDIYPKLLTADAIILASPIFFYAVPAQAKAIVDRTQAMWSERKLRKPMSEWSNYERGKGYLIAVGATKGKNLFEGVELMAKYFFDAMDMSYEGGIFFRRVEDKGSINDHPEYLEQARELGRRAARG